MFILERLKVYSSPLFETPHRDICICENEETASANVFFLSGKMRAVFSSQQFLHRHSSFIPAPQSKT